MINHSYGINHVSVGTFVNHILMLGRNLLSRKIWVFREIGTVAGAKMYLIHLVIQNDVTKYNETIFKSTYKMYIVCVEVDTLNVLVVLQIIIIIFLTLPTRWAR